MLDYFCDTFTVVAHPHEESIDKILEWFLHEEFAVIDDGTIVINRSRVGVAIVVVGVNVVDFVVVRVVFVVSVGILQVFHGLTDPD